MKVSARGIVFEVADASKAADNGFFGLKKGDQVLGLVNWKGNSQVAFENISLIEPEIVFSPKIKEGLVKKLLVENHRRFIRMYDKFEDTTEMFTRPGVTLEVEKDYCSTRLCLASSFSGQKAAKGTKVFLGLDSFGFSKIVFNRSNRPLTLKLILDKERSEIVSLVKSEFLDDLNRLLYHGKQITFVVSQELIRKIADAKDVCCQLHGSEFTMTEEAKSYMAWFLVQMNTEVLPVE